VTLRTFRAKLVGSVRRARYEQPLSEEIETHLSLLAEEFEARGMPPAAARAAARREFGGVEAIKDSTRDERGFTVLASLAQDARYALRQLRRAPSFAAAAILTLGIGIGGTTAIVGVLDVVAFRPLPYPQPERLVSLQETFPTFGPFPVSAHDEEYWAAHATTFDTMALASVDAMNLTGQGEPERVIAGVVQPGFLALLGARPQIGRGLVDGDDQAGRERIVVLNDRFWRGRFNADPAIVGKTIALDGVRHEVVGVLSADFEPPDIKLLHSLPTRETRPQFWRPMVLSPEDRRPIGGYSLSCLARLREGASLAAAQTELARIQKTLVASVPGKGDLQTVVRPLQAQMASRTKDGLVLMLLAVGSVLIVGCVNIASLLVVRVLGRRHELAVREAMGAGRGRIARQLIGENLVLSALGGIAGLVVALITLRVIVWMAPADIPRLDIVGLDARVVASAAILSLFAGALLSAAASLRAPQRNLIESLRVRHGSDNRPSTRRFRAALVVGEIAVGAASVAVAALLYQNFSRLLAAERGFHTERVLTLDLNLGGPRYTEPSARAAFVDGLLDDVRNMPGVVQAAVSSQLPLTGTGALSALSVDGTTLDVPSRPSADVRSVTPAFFETLGIPLRTGALLTAGDRARNVAVLSETLARQGWPDRSPIGQQFRFGANPAAVVYTVIGTVGDIRGGSLDEPFSAMAFVPFPQRSQSVTLLARTENEPTALAAAVRAAVRQRDPEMPIQAFRTMDDVVDASVAVRRFQLQLVGFFALVAAALAGLGVYGTLTHSVLQRRSEIGVRLALGERAMAIVQRIVGEALAFATCGIAVAAALVFSANSLIRNLVATAGAWNPAPLLGAAAAITAMVLLAAALPALRASRVDPMSALRSE
jgi:predicted permease